jgi:hypothetical protein
MMLLTNGAIVGDSLFDGDRDENFYRTIMRNRS